MKKKIVVGCVFAGVMLILISFNSIAEKQSVNSYGTQDSPLFAARNIQLRSKLSDTSVQSSYLGKDKDVRFGISTEKRMHNALSTALEFLGKRSVFSDKFLHDLSTNQKFITLLEEYDVSYSEVKSFFDVLRYEPLVFEEKIRDHVFDLDAGDLMPPAPLSLNTTNPIGCFITALSLAIVAIVLTVLIATITIITCLNIGGCFEKIGQSILDSISQGLSH